MLHYLPDTTYIIQRLLSCFISLSGYYRMMQSHEKYGSFSTDNTYDTCYELMILVHSQWVGHEHQEGSAYTGYDKIVELGEIHMGRDKPGVSPTANIYKTVS